MRIRKDDTVEVIAGADKGTRGRVIRVDRGSDRVVVEGVNRVYKHVRRSRKTPKGGKLSKEAPLSVSNVLLVCTSCGKATRIGVRFAADGSKERFCKKCGASTGVIGVPAK
ncbi:MAG: 50S ribosomal protein L24 [Thermoguttaceae bacterium]|nr:50S ribosomal protein L24 [Thermoguttaceae bacterium]